MIIPMQKSAVLSPCGLYRYYLTRRWEDDPWLPRALWVMLNPSMADAMSEDPTLGRVTAFSQAWGCNSLSVVNLFALRSPKPKALLPAADPIGPENDDFLRRALDEHRRPGDRVILAWGNLPARRLEARRDAVLRMLVGSGALCLRTTASGDPGHPLFVPGSAKAVPYPVPPPTSRPPARKGTPMKKGRR